MSQRFYDLVIGDVLFAPFLPYAALAFVAMLLLRPLLQLIGFDRLVSNPPIAMLGIYLCLLAAIVLLA